MFANTCWEDNLALQNAIYREFFSAMKHEKFLKYFPYFAQIIDCGYTLQPHQVLIYSWPMKTFNFSDVLNFEILKHFCTTDVYFGVMLQHENSIPPIP